MIVFNLGEGNFAGFFLTHKIKAQNFRGKFRSIVREKIRASKKIFRANFVLQTCHPKFFQSSHVYVYASLCVCVPSPSPEVVWVSVVGFTPCFLMKLLVVDAFLFWSKL